MVRDYLRKAMEELFRVSIRSAAQEQGLRKLARDLEKIVPDISGQYSTRKLDSTYLVTKVRNQHAFQISLVENVIKEIERPVIVDIGDSAGTHLQYIRGLYLGDRQLQCLSVNLDEEAVKKIRAKGLEAINVKAEEVSRYDINADIFLCFEMLEHMMDPCNFLHRLSCGTNARYLIVTVPYLRKSRVGLHHIRQKRAEQVNAETSHVFELNPEDWKLLVRHSGWSVLEERVYLQYPRFNLLRATMPLWRGYDFEGFYGLILQRDDAWSSRYLDW